ncbi:hypothetical protein HORIV_67250 [Vreelandella olivaria]|uniref:FAD-binding FR-type domain-containing protein n=1 Tax=Vreelandella olivaria TaxID=390919 RepID=A0ABM7GUB3_9GAMM|nr:hypothetical protein HORIV_67250 [Halomonas olivaria]
MRRVVVAEVKREAEAVIRVGLVDPHGRELPDWTPGSHIELVSGEWRRYYSLCGTRDDRDRLSIAILREPEGAAARCTSTTRSSRGIYCISQAPRTISTWTRRQRVIP